jgi:hypothetical protein
MFYRHARNRERKRERYIVGDTPATPATPATQPAKPDLIAARLIAEADSAMALKCGR